MTQRVPTHGGQDAPLPLVGLKVLDFSTLLPGPLATLVLAEAGATVVKVERPLTGDGLRGRSGHLARHFPMLNAGKRSMSVDLKDPAATAALRSWVEGADVLVEQFRPGVMDRLGLGYDATSEVNPALVYCSITGYGQQGRRSQWPGHDMNYLGESGLLALSSQSGRVGELVPQAQVSDIAGGSYPAVINILLALASRSVTGHGTHLDVSMTANVAPFLYWSIAMGDSGDRPEPGGERLTGGSPRYQTYPTRDGRVLLVASLEDKFWHRFCEAVDLPEKLWNDKADPVATTAAVAEQVVARTSGHWAEVFAGRPCCASVAATAEEAFNDPDLRRPLDTYRVSDPEYGTSMPVAPLPLGPQLRTAGLKRAPSLGELDPRVFGWQDLCTEQHPDPETEEPL